MADSSHLLDNLLVFGRVLQRAGIPVHPGRVLDVVEALRHVDLASREEVYYTCRALLVHRREQLPIFDRVFVVFWRDHHDEMARSIQPLSPPSAPVLIVENAEGAEEAEGAEHAEKRGKHETRRRRGGSGRCGRHRRRRQ